MLLLVPAGILLTRMLRRLPPSSLRPRPMALARCYLRFGPFVLILLANLIHVVSRASWSLNSPRRGRPSGPGPRELRVEEEFCEVRLLARSCIDPSIGTRYGPWAPLGRPVADHNIRGVCIKIRPVGCRASGVTRPAPGAPALRPPSTRPSAPVAAAQGPARRNTLTRNRPVYSPASLPGKYYRYFLA